MTMLRMNMADGGAERGTRAGEAVGRVWAGLRGDPVGSGGRVLLAVWAGFWTWFCVMEGVSEGWVALGPVSAVLAGVWGMALVGFWRARWSWAVLLAGAAASALVFQGPWAWALFAGPLAAAGVLSRCGRR